MCIGGAWVVAETIPSYGPVCPYKRVSGPAGSGEKVRAHPHTAHVIIGQSGGGTVRYQLVRSMQLSQSRNNPYASYPGYVYRQGK